MSPTRKAFPVPAAELWRKKKTEPLRQSTGKITCSFLSLRSPHYRESATVVDDPLLFRRKFFPQGNF